MRPLFLSVRLLSLLLCALSMPLAAQVNGTARIEGTVFDSVTTKPRAGATVTVVRVSAGPMQFRALVSDSMGRFVADSLAPGRYSVEFSTPFLDSLEVQVPARELTLSEGGSETLAFATPSRASLVAVACRGLTLARGRGAIVGSVADADADRPLPGATVAVAWSEPNFDMAARRAVATVQTVAVVTDSLGRFRVCGVPTDINLVMQVQREGRAGTAIRVMVPDDGAVHLQRLSISASATRALATSDSPESDTVTVLLRGTARLAGTARGLDGRPLANVELRIADAAGSARTDSTGAFTLGGLPAGTQRLEARRVGYLVARQSVELRPGTTTTMELRMSPIVTLDSVRIFAQGGRFREFEARVARARAVGSVYLASDIERIRPIQLTDIFRTALGFRVDGQGISTRVVGTRGRAATGSCGANVVINGMPGQDINMVQPSDIAAMEVYRNSIGAPIEYASGCGVIVIWTR